MSEYDNQQRPIDTRHFSMDAGGRITGPHGCNAVVKDGEIIATRDIDKGGMVVVDVITPEERGLPEPQKT